METNRELVVFAHSTHGRATPTNRDDHSWLPFFALHRLNHPDELIYHKPGGFHPPGTAVENVITDEKVPALVTCTIGAHRVQTLKEYLD
jgi:hypothetical protein